MLVDLHVHSNISDGTLSPMEVVIHAKENGLCAIALTDHDTVSGLDEAIEAGKLYQVEVIPGIELAAQFTDYNLHILGYCIDYKDKKFIEKLKPLTHSRDLRNEQMLLKLNNLGFDISIDEEVDIITRAHFAKALYQGGYVKSLNKAFELYLTPGMPGYVEHIVPTPQECIDLIHSAGGIAVLAHPLLYGVDMGKGMEKLIHELVSYGLDGIEAVYSSHTLDKETYFRTLARKHKLLISGGSDFHGENKPGLEIGSGYGSLKVPYYILEEIKNRVAIKGE